MNFSTDRDLLALEPDVFRDLPFVAQGRMRVADGVLDGATLTSVEGDFTLAGVEAGSVLLVEGVPCEVLVRRASFEVEVSMLRTRTSDAAIPPVIPDGKSDALSVVARTFGPQASGVRESLLRLLGVDPTGEDPDAPGEDAVVSLNTMARLEAAGTLERAYSAAIALGGENDAIREKAQRWRQHFRATLATATVLLDLDGDGLPDERRRPGLVRLTRV